MKHSGNQLRSRRTFHNLAAPEQPDLIKWASQPTSYNICGYGIACQLTPLTSPDDMLSLPNSKADQQGCGTATATQADEEPGCITIKHHTQAACISHDTTQCNHHLKHFHVWGTRHDVCRLLQAHTLSWAFYNILIQGQTGQACCHQGCHYDERALQLV